MNLSSQKSAIALSASAAALLMPVSAFAEDGAAGADILIPKMAEFIPALIAFLIIWIVLAKVALPGIMKTMEARQEDRGEPRRGREDQAGGYRQAR